MGTWCWSLPAKLVTGVCELIGFLPPQQALSSHTAISVTPFTLFFFLALDIAITPSSVQWTFPANHRQTLTQALVSLL